MLVSGWEFSPDIYHDTQIKQAIGEQILLHSMGSLGTPLGFKTQRKGVLVQDITPDGETPAAIQSGSNTGALDWHTEDASLKYCCDYIGLFCLDNDSQTATRLVDLWNLELLADLLCELMKPQFVIAEDMPFDGELENPQALVTMYNGKFQFRVDPLFTHSTTTRGTNALAALMKKINENALDIRLSPGEMLIINNNLCAHAREEIVYRYPSARRHLQRLMVFRKAIPPQNLDLKRQVIVLKPNIQGDSDMFSTKTST